MYLSNTATTWTQQTLTHNMIDDKTILKGIEKSGIYLLELGNKPLRLFLLHLFVLLLFKVCICSLFMCVYERGGRGRKTRVRWRQNFHLLFHLPKAWSRHNRVSLKPWAHKTAQVPTCVSRNQGCEQSLVAWQGAGRQKPEIWVGAGTWTQGLQNDMQFF